MKGPGRYLRLLKPYWGWYFAGLSLLLFTNALSLGIPRLLKAAVDALAPAGDGGPPGDPLLPDALLEPLPFALTLLAVGFVLAAVRTGSRVLVLGVGRRVATDLRRRLFDRLLRAAPSFYARYATGELMSRLINDVRIMQAVAAPGVLYSFNALFMFAIAIPYLASIDAGLTGLLVLPYPFLAGLTMVVATRVRRYATEAQQAMDALTTRIQESLAGMEVVTAFSLQARQAAGFQGSNDTYLRKSMKEAVSRGAIGVAATLTGGVATCITLWAGGIRVARGDLTYGDLVLFLTVMVLVVRPTVYLGWVLSLAQRGLASLDRVEELLEAPLTIQTPAGARGRAPVRGEVEARGLTYRYPSQVEGERRLALEDVSFRVPAGAVLGLAGRIGSGKSTILRAAPRFLELEPGALLVDGVPVEEWDVAELRGAIGYVPQDGYVFSMTLGENVAYGRPDAGRDEVLRACAIAELEKDLDQLDGGLEAVVGERGVTLSGGQRQRLAIARAVLVAPRILLLDDALSMVDAETAVAVLANLRAALPETTVVVAAHRTATLLPTDEVLILEAGRVVERGRPGELLERAGSRFRAMHERQRLEQDLEAA